MNVSTLLLLTELGIVVSIVYVIRFIIKDYKKEK